MQLVPRAHKVKASQDKMETTASMGGLGPPVPPVPPAQQDHPARKGHRGKVFLVSMAKTVSTAIRVRWVLPELQDQQAPRVLLVSDSQDPMVKTVPTATLVLPDQQDSRAQQAQRDHRGRKAWEFQA